MHAAHLARHRIEQEPPEYLSVIIQISRMYRKWGGPEAYAFSECQRTLSSWGGNLQALALYAADPPDDDLEALADR